MKKNIYTILILLLFWNCQVQQKTAQVTAIDTVTASNNTIDEPQKINYWQQYVNYKINVKMDVEKHQYIGKETLTYTNNSQDTLYKVYFHLYWNAFQPGSAMDWHNRTLEDPDRGLDTKIRNLKPNEIGFTKVHSLKQNDSLVSHQTTGTILSVKLNKPIAPGASTTFTMDYLTQIPLMLRRGGRNNQEGIDYSMAQWYPKLCEYDTRGWHADPYLGREFYGVWGDYDVSIEIPRKYTIGATGYLQNPENIGKNYKTDKQIQIPNSANLTWHFKANNVHDFSWAADPDYIHDIIEGPKGVKLHFFYQKNVEENWKKLEPFVSKTIAFYDEFVGDYPYEKYSVIQAGDGGMEYAMCTFVYGDKPFNSLRGTVQHELGHSWFQFALASNESEYPWMDEGFTSYIEDMANIFVNGIEKDNPFSNSTDSYRYLVQQGKDEPLNTHADHYNTNLAYWVGAYDKGKLVLSQLGYIMGFDKLHQTLKTYYKNWKMKHPQPNDFFKIAEETSGMNLKWFANDWLETTHHIDYAIDSIQADGNKSIVSIRKKGQMPMPLDIMLVYTDGSSELFNIPLDLMLAHKSNPFPKIKWTVLPAWQYGIPTYKFTVNKSIKSIKAVAIDPIGFMADIKPENNFKEPQK